MRPNSLSRGSWRIIFWDRKSGRTKPGARGTEISLTISAITGGFRLAQTFLGAKPHVDARSADLVAAMRQTVGALFWSLEPNFQFWSSVPIRNPYRPLATGDELTWSRLRVNRKRLLGMFHSGVAELEPVLKQILSAPDHFRAAKNRRSRGRRIFLMAMNFGLALYMNSPLLITRPLSAATTSSRPWRRSIAEEHLHFWLKTATLPGGSGTKCRELLHDLRTFETVPGRTVERKEVRSRCGEMIVNELTQATQELVREFARFLPRLLVMLVVVLLGWLIAYVLKWILRSIFALSQVRQAFRRRRRHATAQQSRAAILHRTGQPLCLLDRMARLRSVGNQRSWDFGHAGIRHSVFHFPAAPDGRPVLPFLRIAGCQLLFSRRTPLGGQHRYALAAPAQFCCAGHDHRLHRFCSF